MSAFKVTDDLAIELAFRPDFDAFRRDIVGVRSNQLALDLFSDKIDTSFTAQLPESGPLIRLIFALANQINASIVAEGVETIEQLEWLIERGCDQVQGFLFSKAVPPEKLGVVRKSIEQTSLATPKLDQANLSSASRGHWV